MEEINIIDCELDDSSCDMDDDYKLDEGFLKEFMFEVLEKPSAEELSIRLPVNVQVIQATQINVKWNSYVLADGEFEMSGCVFLSKQTMPECFSILKIKKISKLPTHMRSDMNDNSLCRLGEIEFDTEVSGEEIGFSLYKDLKYLNIKELMRSKIEIGFANLKKAFETPKPLKIMKHMWENRSETLCDVKVTFHDDEGIERDGDFLSTFAHRSVLLAASEVFKAHSDNVGHSDNKSVHMHIVDSCFHAFHKLLEFIYTGKVQFSTWRLAFQLLYLSKKYLLSDLENICQRVIIDFANYDCGNLLNAFEENQETKDKVIQNHIEENVKDKIYAVINSESFLHCKFSTVEWIMSLGDLVIDEWTRLCAIYKWTLRNWRYAAFCYKRHSDLQAILAQCGLKNDPDEQEECLHSLLECVRYENIDGRNLKRFLKLPKLPEIIDVNELKQSVFDSLLEDDSYLDNGTNYYPRYRGCNSFCVEIEIGNTEDRKMKNIHLSENGPVLGFKIKVELQQDICDNEEHSLDIVLSFEHLQSSSEDNKDIDVNFQLKAIRKKSRSERSEDVSVRRSCRLRQGKWQEFRLHLEDYRGYVSSKIEDFSVDYEGANKSNMISLDLKIV